MSNILWWVVGFSVVYLAVSRGNIGHGWNNFRSVFRCLDHFGSLTVNPRVGGSIPPLATILTTLIWGTAALSGIVLSNGLSVLALRHVGSNQVALVSASDLPAFFGPKHLWRWLKSRCDSHR